AAELAVVEGGVEVAVDVVVTPAVVLWVERDGEAGVAAGRRESRSAEVAEAVVVPDEVAVVATAELVDGGDERLQAGLGAVEGVVVGAAEVEAVVDVVADRLVAAVGAARRRRQQGAVAGVEDVGGPAFEVGIRGVVHLEDDRGGGVRQDDALLEVLDAEG